MDDKRVPLVGVFVELMKFPSLEAKEKALGEYDLKSFAEHGVGKCQSDAKKGPILALLKMLWFLLKGYLGKLNRPHPLFEK